MSSINSVSGYSNYSAYSNISRGGVLTSASSGASELAIQEKTKSQVNGLDVGKENLKSAESALKIEDGALNDVTEFLQKIKEKTVQAMNGTLSDSDKQSIQDQIKQYMQGVEEAAKQALYNEKPLLDGTTGDMQLITAALQLPLQHRIQQ